MESKGFNRENTTGGVPSHRVCSGCGRLLPLDQFYVNNRFGTPERRCKAATRPAGDEGRADIFRVADRNVRLELIRRARQVVRDSMARRLRRVHELEWEQETRDWTV